MKLMIFSLLAISMLTSCAHWNKKRCAETDFNQLGYAEGSQGADSKVVSYNQSCLKKDVKIDMNAYNTGYKRGLQAFCTPQSGSQLGIAGQQPHRNCQMNDSYMVAYEDSLKQFCSVERGTKDGYAMATRNTLCTPYSSYNIGYKNGVKNYCSYEKGQEDGFDNKAKNTQCSSYTAYTSGYSKGQKNFCSPENAKRMGEKGQAYPEKCYKSGKSFELAFNDGRKIYLGRSIKELEVNIGFERRNYESLRDELQDAQFGFSNMPKYSRDPELVREKEDLENRIQDLRKRRDQQRTKLTRIEQELNEMKSELARL